MAERPKFFLLFDLSALTTGKTSEWKEFADVGVCYIPQVVWEEIKFLADRGTDPDLEPVAREFCRFFADSGWQETAITGNHPALQPPAGSALSKQARLNLAVARCAAAFGQEHPQQLVIVVANNQPLANLVQTVGLPNLCSITVATFKPWVRSPHRPPLAVHQQLMDMRMLARSQMTGMTSVTPPAMVRSAPLAQAATPPKVVSRPNYITRPSHPPLSRSQGASRWGMAPIVSSLLTLIGVLMAGSALWRVSHPQSFNRLWQQLSQPSLTRPVAPP